jgi:glycosyltransferase involved in cell wall biosynthesis
VRILLQDFSGHPFQAQLSRSLAARGHEVVHSSCSGYASGHGELERKDGDPDRLRFVSIGLGDGFDKYRYRRRVPQELLYGLRLVRLLRKVKPDVFISCNEPLLAKAVVGFYCWVTKRPWVFWLQDLYSVAMRRELARVFRAPGDLIGRGFELVERWLVRRADGVVMISYAFNDWLLDYGIRPQNAAVIPNWAPLDELEYFESDQGWFEQIGIPPGTPVALYSGTLGRKHDAGMFLVLAERLQAVGGEVVVISEGPAAELLEKASTDLANLHVLPFQPWAEVPKILGSASVLLGILAPEAAQYSVPSKVLTYLCAGRPIVLSMSADNLAAQHLADADAGTVTDPDDIEGFVTSVARLMGDPAERVRMGRNARRFAEKTFDIEVITDQFLGVLEPAVDAPAAAARRRAAAVSSPS